MIKVEQQIRIYEEGGIEIPVGKNRYMAMDSHWNRNEWVVLEIGKENITVSARDLRSAIENATNINRF